MVRGLYTAAAGMIVQNERIDIIANNLANVNTTSYKQDQAIVKEFPQMLLHRMNEKFFIYDGGAFDIAPIVGKIGTGAEVNEKFTDFRTGSFVQTEHPLDFAIETEGAFFSVMTQYGKMYTRNGELNLNNDGTIVTKQGYVVLGENGPINVANKDFKLDQFGQVWVKDFNSSNYSYLDRIPFYSFEDMKYLEKVGDSMYKETRYSGSAQLREKNQTRIHVGFVEASNVNPILEMVRLIEAQRSYEANSKTLQAEDDATSRAINQVGRM
ncbi:MAG: flagellar hook-basal body protein [Spirochaetes bacterium]|jgi:flagellar basal-body rod protein FlgG|nr:flagellar hook-basal body protein [Spirochaetota bacterium]NLJ04884.1 flagellar hook-basal body protein [Exilispira sp.]MBP8990587.1 flagellar hook-basal body protein [Spirochaetota bacterium]HNV44497.1 flagellar hook-basal body protein [Exilispira sp.]HOV45759.1 flagellar hook-basal body protein [Exilispira sp.]